MPDPIHRRPIGVVIGLSLLVVASASTAAFLAWVMPPAPPPATLVNSGKPANPLTQPLTPNPTATNSALPSTTPKVAPQGMVPAHGQTIQVYWLKDSGQQWNVVAVPMQLKSGDRPDVILNAAVSHLLTSTPDGNLTTTIPQGTQLNSLKVQADGIHVDLSKVFKAAGGSTGTVGRVAQILYTVTSLNPESPVWLSVEGKRLESLGGEGLMLEQPLTRQSFERDFKH